MRNSAIRGLIFVVAFVFCSLTLGNDLLISELIRLRKSLPSNDSYRQELTLRLADALFDKSVTLGKIIAPTNKESQELRKSRLKAVTEYKKALRGDNAPPPAGTLRLKIQFQLARLYSDLKQKNEAKPLWRLLSKQGEIPKLKREASLRLAEYAEEENNFADAGKYYGVALDLCSEKDTCAYIHYRRAWLLRRQERISEAVEEIQKGLWDSKDQVRNEALRDLIVFLSLEKSDGTKALELVEDLSAKLSDPALIEELGAAFFSSGNKKAAITVLEYQNSKNPQLFNLVRLLEEHYGQRNWERFREIAEELNVEKAPNLGENDKKIEKVLRRLSVQLDGERTSQPKFSGDFQTVVDLYLKYFPDGKYRSNMMDGWLAAEKDPDKKSERLAQWLNSPTLKLSKQREVQYREMRLALAQDKKKHEIVEQEAAALALLKPKEKDRFLMIQALAIHQLDEARALPLLQELAKSTNLSGGEALRAQQLALQILLKGKDYPVIIAQAETWTKNKNIKRTPQAKAAIAKMDLIVQEAKFEQAASLGETPEALKAFSGFCLRKEFLPKSCENARVLAVKLGNEDTLLAVLEAQGKKEELASEYEAAGYFLKSAALWEELLLKKKTSEISDYLKVALLYELGGDIDKNKKVLSQLVRKLKKQRDFEELAPAIYETFADAGFLDHKLLSLPWPKSFKLKLANHLELEGKPTKKTKSLLLSSKEYVGEAWGNRVLELVDAADARQKKINFYGRRGQQKFQRRLAALKKFGTLAESYLDESPPALRVQILDRMQKGYSGLASEIDASPVPEGLDEQTAAQLRASMAELSAPFWEQSKSLLALREKEVAKLQKVAEAEGSEVEPKKPNMFILKKALMQLHQSPSDGAPLLELKKYFEERGQKRLAAYFEGRMKLVNE